MMKLLYQLIVLNLAIHLLLYQLLKQFFLYLQLKLRPKIISPGLASTTVDTFSSDDEYLLVLPVTIASASPQQTIQVDQITRSFLTNLSQSLSNKPLFSLKFFEQIICIFFSFFVVCRINYFYI